MRARLFLATLRAESRGARGRLAFVGACLAAGVAAVTAVAALSGSIEDGVRARSRALLGADLSIEARRPLPADLDASLASAWAALEPDADAPERVDVREMATLVGAAPREDGDTPPSRLAELKVVGAAWPLYGQAVLDPPVEVNALGAQRCAVAGELLEGLGLDLGDELLLGGARFEIAARVLEEPDELAFTFQPGPRVLLLDEGLERTSLVGFGSRVRHKALVRLPGEVPVARLRELAGALRETVTDAAWLRVRTHDRAQPALRRGLERVERYLGLVALLSLLLGGTGVAQVVRSWLAQRTASIAVLRALGWRPREVLLLYLAHVAVLAGVGSAVGAAVGSLAPLALGMLASDLVPEGLLRIWQPAAVARGLVLGTTVALFFALLPLLGVWRVSPARVLRAEAEPLALPRTLSTSAAALALLAVLASAWWQAAALREAAYFTAGLACLALLLWGASRGLARLARSVPRERFPPALAHGISALGRPSSGTTSAIVALGVGVLVVVSMQLVQGRLEDELSGAIPPDAPTVFLVDVQPDQGEGVRALLDQAGAKRVDDVPVVTARLAAVDGVGVAELAAARGGPRGRSRWVLTREQRLTWLQELGDDNEIVSGRLWSDPETLEVSVEEQFAENLGAGLGTRLEFDVQGVPVELTVTSLRTVDWRSFGINFFLVAEPGALDAAPHMRLVAGDVPAENEERLQSLSLERFPNVTLLRVRPLLARVAEVFERLALAVRALGALTVVAGLAILAGVAASAAAHRGREVALYKTLGVTRRGVALLFATEYALCGLVAGAIGALFAFGLARAFLTSVLELRPDLPLAALPASAMTMALLAAVAGLAASARALTAPPLASLRG